MGSCRKCVWYDECQSLTNRCPYFAPAWDILGVLDDDKRLGDYIYSGYKEFISDHEDDDESVM